MKNAIMQKWAFLFLLGLIIVGCEQKEEVQAEEEVQEVNTAPTKDAAYSNDMSETSTVVAQIQKDGHDYQFIAIGDNDDMVVIENLYGNAAKNAEQSNQEIDQSPLELFLAITDHTVNIPERIAVTGTQTVLSSSGRSVSTSNSSIQVLDPNYNQVQQKSCYDVGYTNFRNSYCGGTPVTSSPGDIRFCDNGLWNSNTRNSYYGSSWRELDDTFTWTNVVCGLTRVQFYAWESSGVWPFNNWAWRLKYQVDFTNGIWYASYYTSSNTERQVKRTRPNNTGSFRAYTRFF